MKQCEILVTRETGQERAGMVIFDGGKVTVKTEKGFKSLMADVKKKPHIVHDQRISLKDDPEEWFDSLPSHYNGSRMRAHML